jgi:DsbC/DsbD-like thiol-disulfide interchange protein
MRLLAITALLSATLIAEPQTKAITKQTKQLQVSSSASAETVAPGQHVTLTLDIDLKPKMHVYAPGVEHYIPIDWQITGSDAAKSEAVKWPKAETLYLEAIDEKVPVYTGSFHLVRNIVFSPGAKSNSEITIHGVLKYQACDDKMCFIPASVPLDWTFHYQARSQK